ncbi:hypothetical protein PMAYCL1PPCAC_32409, partial [Pristionchus mayeri]
FLLGLIFDAITTVTYFAAFSIIFVKRHTERSKLHLAHNTIERKALQSLSVIIVVFILTRLIFVVFINIVDFYGHSKDVIERTQDYMVFSSLICYSSTFYLCFARSIEYRRIFWQQIVSTFGLCGVKLKESRYGTSPIYDPKKYSYRHENLQPNATSGCKSVERPRV